MFLAIEIPGLLNKRPGDTLSEHVWSWFAIDKAKTKKTQVAGQARRFVLLAFMAWLTAHFLSGGRF
jgi:hypothetical protein